MRKGLTDFHDKVPEGPEETYGFDVTRAIRVIDLPNASLRSRMQAVADFLGTSRMLTRAIGGAPRNYIARTLPDAYPSGIVTVDKLGEETASPPFLWANQITRTQNIGIAGQDEDGLPQHTRTRAFLQYSTLPWECKEDADVLAQSKVQPFGEYAYESPLYSPAIAAPDEGDALRRGIRFTRYITRVIEPSGRMVTLPNAFFKWTKPPVASVPLGVGINQLVAQVTYVWTQVPREAYPGTAIGQCSGALNADNFDVFIRGTLLFNTMRERQYSGPLGDRLTDLSFFFLWLPNFVAGVETGHNSLLRVNGGSVTYERISATGDPADPGPYTFADFASLFRPEQP